MFLRLADLTRQFSQHCFEIWVDILSNKSCSCNMWDIIDRNYSSWIAQYDKIPSKGYCCIKWILAFPHLFETFVIADGNAVAQRLNFNLYSAAQTFQIPSLGQLPAPHDPRCRKTWTIMTPFRIYNKLSLQTIKQKYKYAQCTVVQ